MENTTNPDLVDYKCHEINFKQGGSYKDSPNWIKKKKATINPINKKDKCFQYTIRVVLTYDEIGKHPERLTKIKPLIDKYKWEEKSYLTEKVIWKYLEKNNNCS